MSKSGIAGAIDTAWRAFEAKRPKYRRAPDGERVIVLPRGMGGEDFRNSYLKPHPSKKRTAEP